MAKATIKNLDDVLDFASVDVSFISLTKVLIPARELLADNGQMVCLIKPQFEAGREKVGKKGVYTSVQLCLWVKIIQKWNNCLLVGNCYVKTI